MAVYFNRGLGFPLYYVGIIFTLLAAVSMLFSLVGGILSDIMGRKITLILGSSFGSVIFALLAYLTYGAFNPLITALAFILSSISGSLVFPASSAMVSDLTSTGDRSMAYSIYRVVTNLGWAIGPITGSYLSLLGMQWIFVFLSCASIVQLGIILAFVRESSTLPVSGTGARKGSIRADRSLSKDILLFSFATFFIILVASQFSVTLPVYANTYAGVKEWQIGYIYAVNGVVVVLGQIPMSMITRKMRDTTVMMFGMFFYSLGYALIGLSTTLLQIMFIMVIITTGENFTTPGMTTVVSKIAPKGKTGFYMGFNSMMNSTGRALGPSMGSAILYLESARLQVAWVMISSFGIIAIAVMLVFRKMYEPNGTSPE